MDKEKLEELLKDAESRRAEVFEKLQADKDNPYWYEDWGSIIDDLDKQIASLKQKIEQAS